MIEFEEPDDLVPEGYWEKLQAAMARCPKLPPDDLSKDPPVMV